MRTIAATLMMILALTQGVWAQAENDVVWVQVEAHSTLATATERARVLSTQIEDVNGFSVGGGWYGIALGPYTRRDARQVLQVYRRERQIPSDSYIAESASFGQQFWPVGANVLNSGVLQAPANVATDEATADTTTDAPAPEPEVVAAPEPADETPAEARRSEAELDRDQRMELQVALQWAGFYTSTIDGAFGRGTRASMAAWQEANNFEKTGVLTTLQRAALFKQYNAVLEGLGLKRLVDAKAGIELMMPTAVVAFDKYEPPFAHYKANGDIDARVLLISQAGDQTTLFGLYDIMQTLEIVPLNGPRERRKDSFSLVGENAEFISQTEVKLLDGQIKGFTLIWPTNDEERRQRLLGEMQASFLRLDAVLDPAAGSDNAQAIDLVSGLKVRTPTLSRSGFYVDSGGAVVTTAQVVQNCTRITLDDENEAQVLAVDNTKGVALLVPDQALSPARVAGFSAQAPRLQSDVAVAGYSYGGVLTGPSMTFGSLSDVRGLAGETDLNRLSLTPLPGDVGGPVLDAVGGVLGMLLPVPEGDKQLPAEVSFALSGDAILNFVSQAGVSTSSAENTVELAPQDITTRGRDMTVLVSCWE